MMRAMDEIQALARLRLGAEIQGGVILTAKECEVLLAEREALRTREDYVADDYVSLVAAIAVYGEDVDLPAIVKKARTLISADLRDGE